MLSIFQEHVTLQTFRDHDSATGYAEIRSGTLKELEPWARQKNAQNQGVYATVNATDGKGREIKNITAIRAFFCDIDGLHSEAHKRQKA